MKKEIIFQKKVKIQALNRIALSPELLENLDLKMGDDVSVFLDTEKQQIVVRKEK
jgi:bifunctional DNA-binding transcriptional regulator/antitoxin component of YhaV-PrlF toxin-antitoxin module